MTLVPIIDNGIVNDTSMEKNEKKHYHVVVIGGGPAGMMAAGRAAECGARVLLIEKNARLGEKLLITGGGRSNITNNETNIRKLLEKFKGKGKFLFSAFAQFSVSETLDFFHTHGVPTILEAEGRVFPKTEKSESVWNCLKEYMKKYHVDVRMNAPLKKFNVTNGAITSVTLMNGEIISGNSYIIATGGTSRPETGSTGDGFAWLRTLGHTVRSADPALVPIRTKEKWGHKLSGLAFKSVKVTTKQNNVVQDVRVGKILFTHVGLSGPLILNMSKDISELLKYGSVTLTIDIFPTLNHRELDKHIHAIFQENQNKKLRNVLGEIAPSMLAKELPTLLTLDGEKEVNIVTRDERQQIVKFLKEIPLTPTGTLGVNKAVVVSGGVDLREVDFRTMQSRIYPNLHIVGDLLDIDRPSGGYSLQLCWTTGWVAGTHAERAHTTPSSEERMKNSDLA